MMFEDKLRTSEERFMNRKENLEKSCVAYAKKFAGRMLRNFHSKGGIRTPVGGLLGLEEFAGCKREVLRLQKAGIRFIDQMEQVDYTKLAGILGMKRAEYYMLALSLYGLAGTRKIHPSSSSDETQTTIIVAR